MHDPLSRAERLIAQLGGPHGTDTGAIDRIGLKIAELVESQKRTTSKIDALRQLIERNGNARAGH